MPKLKASPFNPQMDPSSPLIVAPSEISSIIDSFKEKFSLDRYSYIKNKFEENKQGFASATRDLYKLSTERRNLQNLGGDGSVDLLSKRQKDAIDVQNGVGTSSGNNNSSSQEDGYASAVLLGSSIAVKNAVCPINLPEVEKLPPYTTWVFLHRNQKMTEDQSVVGRRRIYYDKNCGEALIYSDSDEDVIEGEEGKEFAESEDYILRLTIEKVGMSDMVLDLLANRFSRKPSEVKARYEDLIKEEATSKNENTEDMISSYLDKDLGAAMDSFDNLFCERCLIFDCRLHGCSQELTFPTEKPPPWFCADANKEPCGLDCYLAVISSESNSKMAALQIYNHEEPPLPSFEDGSNNRSSKQIPKQVVAAGEKRQKKRTASESNSSESLALRNLHLDSSEENGDVNSSLQKEKSINARKSSRKESSVPRPINSLLDTAAGLNLTDAVNDPPVTSNHKTAMEDVSSNKCWRRIEKVLFEKGLEIFGRNSCLIARNLLNGLRSCLEVFHYMNLSENKPPTQAGGGVNCVLEVGSKGAEVTGNDAQRKSRVLRRRGRVRRLKYTRKSGGYNSIRKRIAARETLHPYYTPCNCKSPCGKNCPCVVKSICCEKFCGCSKNCKARFRGCHCVKKQCRTDLCPCFVARRDCDPDICHYCWVSCGDDYWIPPDRISGHNCMNMRVLLRQQQKVLLGRSDVSGWGAFLKNSVGANEFLGEYTGEVISLDEAEKRGKIYDRENHSFLFNLDDANVIDAHRKGNKLKFANHSSDPNCVAKIMRVGGDYKVAIFSLKPIKAGEELFYDYQYDQESCPAWAKDRLGLNSKDGAGPSSRRAKKHT